MSVFYGYYKYSISNGGISSVAIGGGSAGAYALKYIIGSWECFHAMDPKALAREWQKTDFFTRFGGVRTLLSHNQMWLWRYYRAHVYAKIDKYSGMVFLKVDGADPDFVYHTSQRVISYAKKKLSIAGVDAYSREYQKIESKLVLDRQDLARDLQAMSEFQQQYGIADYDALYTKTLNLIAKFQEEKVSLESRSNVAQAFEKKSQELAILKLQLATIDKNIEKQKEFILKNMAPVYEKFSYLTAKVKEDMMVIQLDSAAVQTIEQMAISNSFHIDVIQAPQDPTDPTLPYALLWTVVTFGVSWLLYLIVK
ncbi:MAG: hypothetical protein IIT54_06745 [Acetobacter sp.]|nr:hypothetical protein [Acetobacter sp.]